MPKFLIFLSLFLISYSSVEKIQEVTTELNTEKNFLEWSEFSAGMSLIYFKWNGYKDSYQHDFFVSDSRQSGFVVSPLILKEGVEWSNVNRYLEKILINVNNGELEGLDLSDIQGTPE